nr:hypothetical protein GCM10010200_003740 [Actinomadura rugatobispora]
MYQKNRSFTIDWMTALARHATAMTASTATGGNVWARVTTREKNDTAPSIFSRAAPVLTPKSDPGRPRVNDLRRR